MTAEQSGCLETIQRRLERALRQSGLGGQDMAAIADQPELNDLLARIVDDTIAEERRHFEQSLAEIRLLYETSRCISTALGEDEVIEAYLEYVAARGRYACGIMLYEFDPSGNRTTRVLWGRWTPEEGLVRNAERLPYTVDAFVAPLDAGQTVMIPDLRAETRVSPTFHQYLIREHWWALAMIPLIVHGWRLGTVWLSSRGIHEWQDRDLQPYEMTAVLLATAIDNRRQHLQLAERSRQIAVLDERRRLARELHDSVTQSLFGMSLLTQVLPELWEVDQAEARDALVQVRDLTRSALAEMRALLFELRPAALGKQDLACALRDLAETFGRRTGLAVRVEIESCNSLPELVEQALYRIAQEALANIARHAHARQVRLSLRQGSPTRLSIADDGKGFQPAGVGAGHFGLLSMHERATAINAGLHIHSLPGQGTEIVVEWPELATETLWASRRGV